MIPSEIDDLRPVASEDPDFGTPPPAATSSVGSVFQSETFTVWNALRGEVRTVWALGTNHMHSSTVCVRKRSGKTSRWGRAYGVSTIDKVCLREWTARAIFKVRPLLMFHPLLTFRLRRSDL